MNYFSLTRQAFSTLFLMYHKATACNVIPDIIEVVNLLQTILSCCNAHSDGKIMPFFDPLFDGYTIPNHFNCIALREWSPNLW